MTSFFILSEKVAELVANNRESCGKLPSPTKVAWLIKSCEKSCQHLVSRASCHATRSGERNVLGNFVEVNGDVLLVTQCGIQLWGFRSDKKVVQLRILLQRFCTVSTETYYVFHSDTVLCRIASRHFVKNGFCEGLRRLAAKLRRFKSGAGRRIALSHRKNEV